MATEAATAPAAAAPRPLMARLWRWATEPPAWMVDKEQRRKARLLATMTLPFLFIVLLSLIVIPDSPTYPKVLALGLLAVFSLINGLSRSRYYMAGAVMMLMLFTVLPYYQMISTGDTVEGGQIIWGVCAVLLANLLMSRTATLLTLAVVIGFPLLIVAISPEVIFSAYSRNLFVIASASILTLIFSHQRDLLEADRQQELKAINVELEARAREAREANRLKDQFLATMSHELRTPLNAIIGFMSLMVVTGKLDPDNTFMAERSLVNAERLLGLINNVLDISRITSGRLELVIGPVSVAKLAETVRRDMELQIKEKSLTFDVEVDSTLPETIQHDEERLLQLVTNLVGNAIKFTEQGKIALALARKDDRLVIRVTDTGIGIPPAKQQLIFDEFSQADSGYSRKHGGAGLGLSIVKRLVILMNGSVKVVSDVGKGSTFTVEVPLELGAASAQPAAAMIAAG